MGNPFAFLFYKKMDRSVFIHHGTGIPRELRNFFDISDIKFKEKRKVIIKFKNNVFSGLIECDNRNSSKEPTSSCLLGGQVP